jgi:hypothetical protein
MTGTVLINLLAEKGWDMQDPLVADAAGNRVSIFHSLYAMNVRGDDEYLPTRGVLMVEHEPTVKSHDVESIVSGADAGLAAVGRPTMFPIEDGKTMAVLGEPLQPQMPLSPSLSVEAIAEKISKNFSRTVKNVSIYRPPHLAMSAGVLKPTLKNLMRIYRL